MTALPLMDKEMDLANRHRPRGTVSSGPDFYQQLDNLIDYSIPPTFLEPWP